MTDAAPESSIPEILDRAEKRAVAQVARDVELLGPLDETYREGRTPPEPGASLHLFLLGVDERFAGRGVAKRLVADCLAHGVARGYRMAVTEATNKTSQHIFRKAGFVERVHGSYADHRFQGEHVFASIVEHGGPILMDRPLEA